MTTGIRNVALSLALAALLGGIASMFAAGERALANFEIGFFSALFVLIASSFGYWQMVQGSGQSRPHYDLPDETERIDDRFGLWEEDPPTTDEEDVKKLLRQERSRIKKGRRDFRTLLETSKPALSLYRLVAYAVLVYGVYRLISDDSFEPIFYLAGAGAAPFVTAVTLWIQNRG